MEVIIQPDATSGAELGARIIEQLIRTKPSAVIGLATGGTPVPLYCELIRMHREEGLDFSGITTYNLDEYIGLSSDHPASYHRFMHMHLFDHVNVDKRHIHIPDGMTKDIPAFCREYEDSISKSGGIDLQLLGIGHDGHIGFNEPSSSLSSRTRIKTLTEETVEANRRFFSSAKEVPQHVITMGVGTIMEARTCLLLAFGEGKAKAVAATVEGPVTAMCPASALQFHPRTILITDEPAAKLLHHADYYRRCYDNKPAFQSHIKLPSPQ